MPSTSINENSTMEEIFQYVSELARLNPLPGLWDEAYLPAMLNEQDKVVEVIRRNLAKGPASYLYLIDPIFKNLRDHPVMDEVRQALKLPTQSRD